MLGDLMYLENIREYVEDHRIIVTYKWLSRELNVPVNAAKQMLYAYAEQNPSATVTYMVSGRAVISGQEEFQVHLVKKEELEGLKEELEEVMGVHVFSVQMGNLKDSGSLFAASYDVAINNVQEYSRWSTIDCPHWQPNRSATSSTEAKAPVSSTVEQAPISTPVPPPTTEAKNASTTEVSRTTGAGQQKSVQSSAKQSRQQKSSSISKKSNQPKSTDKKIPTKPKTKKPFFPPSNQEKSVKGEGSTIQEVSVKEEPEPAVTKEQPVTLECKDDDDSNDSLKSPEGGRSLDSPSPENTSPVEGKQKKAQHDRLQFLNNSDIDDGDSAEEPEGKPASKVQVKKEKKTKRKNNGRSKASKESTAVEILSKKRKRVQELSSDEEAVPEEAERETKKKRKRTKKLVSRVHINEEGEMVTEKVWESDSVTDNSEEESMPVDNSRSPAKLLIPATSKVSPVKQEKKKQSSLFKFLKK